VDRFTIAIAGGVLALVAAALAAAAIVRDQSPPPDVSTPSGVVLAYAEAEQRGDGAAAWDLLTASTRARADRDQFLVRVGQNGPGRTSVYLSTEAEQVTGDMASVVLARTSRDGGGIFSASSYTMRTIVRLTREPAGWRISLPPDGYNLVPPPKS
jgi:opacity protein-like surface antigen